MTSWRNQLATVIENIDHVASLATRQIGERLGRDPLQVLPYRGFGTADSIQFSGRVLENKELEPAEDFDTIWDNLVAMYRRFESDEIANARVLVEYGGQRQEVVTDYEGYFHVHMTDVTHESSNGWQDVMCTLLDSDSGSATSLRGRGEVIVPSTQSNFGVISDLDDTVLQTHATDLLKMARVTFLNNARTRLPFEGVSAFYSALYKGQKEGIVNPIFYVSSSPWNLYDLLIDFMNVHGIPPGPLFLRDFGLSATAKSLRQEGSGHHGHKLAQIERIMTAFDALPFILIGDSGQEDPEIYREVVHRFPNRIAAIYLRDVSVDKGETARDAEIEMIIDELSTGGEHGAAVEMLHVADTNAAAEHAAAHGFITRDELTTILADQQNDAAAPSDLELLLEEATQS